MNASQKRQKEIGDENNSFQSSEKNVPRQQVESVHTKNTSHDVTVIKNEKGLSYGDSIQPTITPTTLSSKI